MTATTSYLVLFRGVNVGGKNKMVMSELKLLLEEMGFENVATYMQSGNALLRSPLAAKPIAQTIEANLGNRFRLDSSSVKVLALARDQLQGVIDNRPRGFGDEPDKFHSDAIFLIGIGVDEALTAFSPLDGVDAIWPGNGIIYSQRLSTKRTKSRLNRIMASPLYQSMTIRSWGTTIKLLNMLKQ